jgi:hypothetical protein
MQVLNDVLMLCQTYKGMLEKCKRDENGAGASALLFLSEKWAG